MKGNILKDTFKTYFKNFFSYFSLSLLYTSFILLGFIGVYFLFPLIALVLIFDFVPFSFSLHYCVNEIKRGEGFSFASFFKGYALYFSPMFRGGYSSIRNVVFSTLLFFLIAMLVFMPFEFYEIFNNQELYNLMMSNQEVSYETLYEMIFNNATINLGFNLSFSISGLIVSLLFLHFHLKRSILISNQLHAAMPQPMGMVKQFGKYQFKIFRGKFYKEYFKLIWLPIILYVLGFGLGFFLHFKFMPNEADRILGLGFIGGIIFLIPVYPLMCIYMDNIVFYHLNSFTIAYAKSIIYNLSRLPIERFPKEEKETIRRMLDEADIIIKNTKED